MKNIINQKHIFLYVILVFLTLAPIAEGAALDFCDYSHHVDIGGSEPFHDCCDSSFNEKSHCLDPHIYSLTFLSSANSRPIFQQSFLKLLLCHISVFQVFNNPLNIHPKNLIIHLPDDLSHQLTTVLLI